MAPQEMDPPPLERAQNEDSLTIYKGFSSGQLPSSGRGCHAGCTQNRPPAAHLEGELHGTTFRGGSYMGGRTTDTTLVSLIPILIFSMSLNWQGLDAPPPHLI